MSRSNRDAGGYRGRRTVTDVLKVIAWILAVLVVLAVAGVIYLQRYMVYTDEGARLELPPFLQSLRQGGGENPAGGSASLPNQGDVSIDIQPAGSQSEERDPQGPEVERPAKFALQLSVDDVVDGSAAQKLAEAGADALVLEVKGASGMLAWRSAVSEAERGQVNGTQTTTDALRQWNAGEVYTIARVCCFRDDTAAYHLNKLALHQSNGTWRDTLGIRWFSPAQDKVQAYIANLCGELGELGFDEIVLEQFTFPTQGHLERIIRGDDYNSAQFSSEMESFLTQVHTAVEPYGAKISLWVERDTLAGTENVSGVDSSMLERFAARLWVEEDGLTPVPLDLLERAGITGGAGRLVEIRDAHRENAAVPQAVLFPTE